MGVPVLLDQYSYALIRFQNLYGHHSDPGSRQVYKRNQRAIDDSLSPLSHPDPTYPAGWRATKRLGHVGQGATTGR